MGTRTQPLDSWRMVARMKRGSRFVSRAMRRVELWIAASSGAELRGTWYWVQERQRRGLLWVNLVGVFVSFYTRVCGIREDGPKHGVWGWGNIVG